MTRVIDLRATSYDLSRPSDSVGRFGESGDGETVVSDVSLWVHEPRQFEEDTDFGERATLDMRGLARPSADVQPRDRLTVNGQRMEVEAPIVRKPSADNPQYVVFSLQFVNNDG
jgi:hypothetical protein